MRATMKRKLCLLVVAMAGCGADDEMTLSPDASRGGVDANAIDAPVVDAAVDVAAVADVGIDSGGGDTAPVVSCTAGTARCVETAAEVCVPAGNAWNRLMCPNGCENGVCKPQSLQAGWKVHQFVFTDDPPNPARYVFENDGLVATQTANPVASAYYLDAALPESVSVTGKFSVRTTADDDLIGFVFGWQDPEHFYLFDWKKLEQPDNSCGLSKAGASLKVIKADMPLDKCADLWASAGTMKVTPLVKTDVNPLGWKHNANYELRLTFKPGDIKIEIWEGATMVMSLTSNDATYRGGKFGFYNYSQPGVRYEGFSFSPL
jgi:hypothetical protein